jgi:hypothetical protein
MVDANRDQKAGGTTMGVRGLTITLPEESITSRTLQTLEKDLVPTLPALHRDAIVDQIRSQLSDLQMRHPEWGANSEKRTGWSGTGEAAKSQR